MKYPITLTRHPNWPPEMKCKVCGFRGVFWMGVTKYLFNVLTNDKSWAKCQGCGAGIIQFSEEKLPVFILKNE
jgi:hypothetical protein